MSKIRPSECDPAPMPHPPARLRKMRADYWLRRLFQNSFTRNGRLLKVNGWSVKIQHQGKRSSFSLVSEPREEAAQEALGIYSNILTRGWNAALREYKARMDPANSEIPDEHDTIPRTDPRYWQPRLIQRKYCEALGSGAARNLSVRIQHEGSAWYFPLNSDQEKIASRNAQRIYQTILTRGWNAAFGAFPREITVAVFWSTNPLGYTYTTLFTNGATEPADTPTVPKHSADNLRVAIIEGEDPVRNTLARWINPQKGFRTLSAYSTGRDALRGIQEKRPELVLVNRALPDLPAQDLLSKLRAIRSDIPAFTYGVYEDSDQVYYSFSGVSAGYAMRRRPPNKLLEPIESGTRPYSRSQASLQIQQYFQGFFRTTSDWDEPSGQKLLTPREHEILDCVGKGFVDKEIAVRLGISPWTVHGHLRNIYEKLHVRTRTEAVVKYLQK